MEGRAGTMGVERRVDENSGEAYRKNCMRQVPSTPSGNPYPAMIQLGRRIGIEYTRRTVTLLDGNAYTENFSAMVVYCDVLFPAGGHLPPML
jgi:hypothetical protein